MSVDRRELFKIVGAGVVAQSASGQHAHPTPAAIPGGYKPRALSAIQYATLERLLEILLPADAASASAKDAGVAAYIDTTLTHGDPAMRQTWLSGLEAIDSGRHFTQKSIQEGTSMLAQIALKESQPSTDAEKFFVIFKQSAINAYYLAEAGRKSLGYRGDTAIVDFQGCTHAEHRTG